MHGRVLTDLGPECRHRNGRSKLVEESESDAQQDDYGDDDRVGPPAGEPGNQRRAEKEDQYGILDLAPQNDARPHTVDREHICSEFADTLIDLRSAESLRATG